MNLVSMVTLPLRGGVGKRRVKMSKEIGRLRKKKVSMRERERKIGEGEREGEGEHEEAGEGREVRMIDAPHAGPQLLT